VAEPVQPPTPEIIGRRGRQFRISWGRCGDARGWLISERVPNDPAETGIDGPTRWEHVDGAYRSKRDARERADEIAAKEASRG
jgi:hypothetical protein